MFKFYFLAVTYGIAFLIIGVCLRKLVVNGDFITNFILKPQTLLLLLTNILRTPFLEWL